jgi:hemerythrin-like metal-binding protein
MSQSENKPIAWTEDMSVGLSMLDADHRVLIDLINRLDSVAGATDAREDVVRRVIDALVLYASFHFEREEKVMAACGFPGMDPHMEEHAAFFRHVNGLRGQIGKTALAALHDDLLEYLRNWLRHHILIQDMAYKPFVEAKPEAQTAARDVRPLSTDV